MDLPISFVDVQASTHQPEIGLGPVSLSTTVQVSGDVASMPFPGTSGLAPLDIAILLDCVSAYRFAFMTSAKAHLLTYWAPAFCGFSHRYRAELFYISLKSHHQSRQGCLGLC